MSLASGMRIPQRTSRGTRRPPTSSRKTPSRRKPGWRDALQIYLCRGVRGPSSPVPSASPSRQPHRQEALLRTWPKSGGINGEQGLSWVLPCQGLIEIAPRNLYLLEQVYDEDTSPAPRITPTRCMEETEEPVESWPWKQREAGTARRRGSLGETLDDSLLSSLN